MFCSRAAEAVIRMRSAHLDHAASTVRYSHKTSRFLMAPQILTSSEPCYGEYFISYRFTCIRFVAASEYGNKAKL